MRLFGSDTRNAAADKQRIPRHSSGWDALRAFLKEQDGLRVLDIGPTSATNINLLTGWGQSIYMADLVGEAQSSSWLRQNSEGESEFDVERFLNVNLALTDRHFDVVLFWDSADYLPPALVTPLFTRLHDIMAPGGKMLVFGHVKTDTGFGRYHLREDAQVDFQQQSEMPVKNIYTNRQMETLLHSFATYRFFLAKDNLREILVSR